MTVASSALLLGIDIGTSVVKSVVFDAEGRTVAAASRIPQLIRSRQGWSEVDMEALWQDVASTLSEVMTHGDVDPSALKGVGVSGTCCSSWLIDGDNQPIRNAILWNDGRAADIVRGWTEAGIVDRVFGISGNVVFPGFTVAVVRWLKENEPETLNRARRSVFCKDWIRLRLTGVLATEHTDASALPYDIADGLYSDEVLRLCDVEDLKRLLPPLHRPADIVGSVRPEVSRATGLPEGLPIVAGMMDVAATTLGAGAAKPGQACTIVGTSFLNAFLLQQPSFEPPGVGIQMRTADDLWLRAMVNTAGTINLDWFIENLCSEEWRTAERTGASIYAWAEEQAAAIPIGADGLLYHPYLNTTGVISPFFHPGARAQFFGLSLEHTRAHMLRAVYEGVALAMADCSRALPCEVAEWFVAGGRARSAFWCQMFADCTGKTILVPDGEEFGARGVAVLAGLATGVYRDLDDAMQRTIRVNRRHDPDPAAAARYAELHALYSSIHEHLWDDWWTRFHLVNRSADHPAA